MKINIERNIGKGVLTKLLPIFTKKFWSELPNTPQNLLKYAKRRVSPFISPYIGKSLRIKMLESRMTDEEYLFSFYHAVHMHFYKIEREEKPVSSIILSQTGAGKSELAKLIINERKNSVIINTDLYKKFNPKIDKIFMEDPNHLGELTAIDSYDLANNIKEFAIQNKYDLIFELAPCKNEIIGIDTKTLNDKGYNIRYYILAVGDLISSLSIHSRYEKKIKEDNHMLLKLTNLNRHDESYRQLLKIIKILPVDKTNIYRRGTEKEGFVPQLLNKNQKNSLQSLYSSFIFERERSNKIYIFGQGTNNNFLQDYYRIKSSMIIRNAPETQFIQLKNIYEKYVRYMNFLGFHINKKVKDKRKKNKFEKRS